MRSSDEEVEEVGQWQDWGTPKPKDSSTELCIGDLSEGAHANQIAAILGGGHIVRDVRRKDNHTYVAFWTRHDANEALQYAHFKFERAGYTFSYIQRARWRDDLHSHETSWGQDAAQPYYTPFDPAPMYQEWGETKTKRRTTQSATSEGSSSDFTERRITQSATSEGSSSYFTATVQMRPAKKRTR